MMRLRGVFTFLGAAGCLLGLLAAGWAEREERSGTTVTVERLVELWSASVPRPFADRFAREFLEQPDLKRVWQRHQGAADSESLIRDLREQSKFRAFIDRYSGDPDFRDALRRIGRDAGVKRLIDEAQPAAGGAAHAGSDPRPATSAQVPEAYLGDAEPDDGGTPDLDVLYIERLPRHDYDGRPNAPRAGSRVRFVGHVRNSGDGRADGFAYEWRIDGVPARSGKVARLRPGQRTTVNCPWRWNASRHTVSLTVRPKGGYREIAVENNSLTDATDALAIGFWVERSLYDWFGENQVKLGIGSNSWEDWAQRQVREWNRLLQASSYPSSPDGALDRVRLDKVVVVDDGALPLHGGLATNNPDGTDKTVDLMWGFPSRNDKGVASRDDGFYGHDGSPRLGEASDNPFYIERSLVHELGHARYLVDWYAWNFNPHPGMDDVKVVRLDGRRVVEPGAPLFYHCAGGVMSCRTDPGREWAYDEADLYALNRIAGRRARCGNQNAPCNLGEFLLEQPRDHAVRVLSPAGEPVAGTRVQVYRSEPGDPKQDFYAKIVDAAPDVSCTTDQTGECSIGAMPYGALGNNWDAFFRGVALIQATRGGVEGYRWLYMTDGMLQYATRSRDRAMYEVRLDSAPAGNAGREGSP